MRDIVYLGKFAMLIAALAMGFYVAGCSCDDDEKEGDDGLTRRDAGPITDDDDSDAAKDDDDDTGKDDDDATDDDDDTGKDDDDATDDDDDTGKDDDDSTDDDDAGDDDDDRPEPPDTPAEICGQIPTALDFGKVEIGFSSSRSIDIENCGGKTLEIKEAKLDPVVGDFSRRGTYDAKLGYQDKTTITIVYTPSVVGKANATMKIVTNDEKQLETVVTLTGEGAQDCKVRCIPVSHEYGYVELGIPSKAKFLCENRGAATQITSIKLQQGSETNYVLHAPPTPANVAQYGAVGFQVDFIPQRTGQITATAEVQAASCPDTILGISLVGYGAEDIIPECWSEQSYEPRIKWEWDASQSSLPKFSRVFMTPVVAPLWDTNADGVVNENDMPVVVFSGYDWSKMKDAQRVMAAIHLANGKTGSHINTFTSGGAEVNFASQLAIGDINNDGAPEIIGVKYMELPSCKCKHLPFDPLNMCCKHLYGHLLAFDRDGNILWESERWEGTEADQEQMGAPYLADLNADGTLEIIFGNHVFNNEGKLIWAGQYGRGNAGRGQISVAHDITGDGRLEVIAGNTAYRYDGTLLWQAKDSKGKVLDDGTVALADLNLDGNPQIVLNTYKGVYYITHTGTVTHGPLGQGQGGCCVTSPAIADLDGDGHPEVIITNYLHPGSTSENEMHIMLALRHDGSIFWQNDITDSTGAAHAVVFDFDGDGKYEIVYGDEAYVYIIRGHDGSVLYKESRGSSTGGDSPVVVDVDNNKHAEIVCPLDGVGGTKGIRVYFTEPERWMGTRKIWPQQVFSGVEIGPDMKPYKVPMEPWKVHNIYRGNAPICK